MDERVHDVHSLFGNTNVWVDLFKDFVDIDGEGLDSSSPGLLVGFGFGFLLSHVKVYIIRGEGLGIKIGFLSEIIKFKF